MRSSFWRIVFGTVIALFAPIIVVLILAILILWVPPVGRYALRQALVRVAPRVGIDVRFGRIEGNIMRSIALDDVVLKLGTDSLAVKRLALTYDPWTSIVHRSFSASSASAVEPRLFISSNRPESGRREPGRAEYPPIRIGQLRLARGSVYIDTARRLDSVDLTLNLVSEPAQLRAQLFGLSARLARESVQLALRGNVRLTPDSLVASDVVASTMTSLLRADVRMAFSSSAVAARVESLSVGLPEFTPFSGRIRAAGVVGLVRNEPSGSVKYSAEGLVWQGIDLPAIGGSLGLEDSVVRLSMSGSDTALGSADVAGRLDLRNLNFSSTANLTGVRIKRLHSALPEARADIELKAEGRDLDSVVAVVSARAPELGIDRLALAGRYLGRAQSVAVEQFELSGPVGSVSGQGVWRKGKVQAQVRLEQLDLGMVARLESLPLQGKASGTINVTGTGETLDASVRVTASDLYVAGVSATRASADLAVTVGHALSGRVLAAADRGSYGGTAVDSLRLTWEEQRFSLGLWRPGVGISADGNARLERDFVDLHVDTLRVRTVKDALTFTDAIQFGLRPESLTVGLAAVGLAGGDVHATFASAAGKPSRVEAVATRLDLARLNALLGVGLEMSGTASLRISGSDSFDVAVEAEQLSIPFADVDLSRVQGTARVSWTRAAFDHLWLVHQDSMAAPETSTVTGWFEYSTRGGFQLGAADLRARLRNPGAWVVFYLKSIIELQQGTIYGDLAVRGGLIRPVFDGRVRISQARLGVPVIGAAFDRVNAELVFDRSRINIEKLSGRSEHGNALVNGFVDIGSGWQVDSLRFHGDFTGTTINPVPEVYGTIGGNLDLDWRMGSPYELSGTVNVEEALIAFGFGQSAVATSGAPDTMLTYDVRVRGDRDIWFRNQLADIELACDLTVRKTTRDVLYSGELTSRQGSIYYLDNTLRIDSGTVRFENISTLNPEFNVTAEKPIPAAENQSLPRRILLKLTGTLEQPNLAFSSDPPGWGENEIISYLTLNVPPGQEDSVLANREAVTRLLGGRVLNYFQTQVSKRARGFVNLDYLEFESGLLSSSKQARVTVGKYIARNLYVSYTQNFGSTTTPSFRVEYYIDRKNEILAEGNAASAAGEDYRTSLRYRFRLRY